MTIIFDLAGQFLENYTLLGQSYQIETFVTARVGYYKPYAHFIAQTNPEPGVCTEKESGYGKEVHFTTSF